MTRRYIHIYNNVREILRPSAFCMMFCALCLVLVGCSSDDDTVDEPNTTLSLVSCTRAIDTNYSFTDGTKLWLTLTSGESQDSWGYYTYNSENWTGGITVKEAKQYYLYGAMSPTGNLDCSITSADYSKGATMTIRNVSPLLAESEVPYVVVGATGVAKDVQATGVTPSENWHVTEGNFGYMGVLKSGEDNAQILLDHLYTALTFSFAIDETYAKLRTIKLTSLKLKATTTTYDKVDLTVVLEAKNNGTSPIKSVSATATSTTAVNPVSLFPIAEGDDASVDISTLTGDVATAKIGLACFASSIASNLSVECEYDVYDKKTGEPNILAHRTAVNSLKDVIAPGTLPQGKKRTIELKVAPTYLYILSDADLDNPEITVGTAGN